MNNTVIQNKISQFVTQEYVVDAEGFAEIGKALGYKEIDVYKQLDNIGILGGCGGLGYAIVKRGETFPGSNIVQDIFDNIFQVNNNINKLLVC